MQIYFPQVVDVARIPQAPSRLLAAPKRGPNQDIRVRIAHLNEGRRLEKVRDAHPTGLERSLIGERTKAGRTAAVARGVKMGRKPKLTSQQVAHAQKLIEQGEHHNTVAISLGVSRRTLYRGFK